jgi:adenylate kinase family enzyme
MPDLVLFFDCEKSIALDRYLNRKLKGRLEDNEEMFQTRYCEFECLNPPVLEYYQDLGLLLKVCLILQVSAVANDRRG